MINKKKAMSQVWWVLITALLTFLIFILISIFGSTALGKQFKGIGGQIDSLSDSDRDKVANFLDNCPCTAVLIAEEPNLKGCPKGTKPEDALKDSKLYIDKGCNTISVVTSESQKLIEQSKQPIQTTFSLSENGVSVGDGYSTSGNQLLLELGCAKKCTLIIIKPVVDHKTSSDQEVINFNAGSGSSLIIPLQEKGSYMICLKEEETKEKCYYIKKN